MSMFATKDGLVTQEKHDWDKILFVVYSLSVSLLCVAFISRRIRHLFTMKGALLLGIGTLFGLVLAR